ncbi:MAG: hypothetical protein JRF32_12485 [Deltaproteobacteria bacterium]|nr:hypothetical protein [Deltaproteobacteria bacterium]MBW2613273.1 hypothetical protein [Deltaproteobacteria bacterium]MBW2678389.1 hypothetical protein [Deltaproteobacteria bacterium]
MVGQAWLDSSLPDYHGNQPQQDCADCHDLAVRCYQCHFGETGSKSPIGSGWPHGVIDGHNDRESFIATCNRCHGLTRTYRNEPAGCHDCHDD